MPDSHFNHLLANSISSLKLPDFTSKLMAFVSSLLHFDCAVILGMRKGKHPIYLYDSIRKHRELLFDRYLTAAFQDDPFHRMLAGYKHQGVFSLKDVNRNGLDYQNYCNQFYVQTGWKDELSIAIEIEPSRWVVIYLGYLDEKGAFSLSDIETLKSHFTIIQSLCQQHWRQSEFLLAESLFNSESSPLTGRRLIDEGLADFGRGLLSNREHQIVRLILQGLDSREIALQLKIKEGTIKNHRKRIYSRLRVSSLSELFQIFINHIITR